MTIAFEIEEVRARIPRMPKDEWAALRSDLLSALQDFHLPDRYGLLFMGSLAEGFGNALSDIDAFVIDPNPMRYAAFRQITWIGERRVEIFFRSIRDLVAIAERVHAARSKGNGCERRIDEDDLDLYHRICYGVAVRGEEIVDEVRRHFDPRSLAEIVSAIEWENASRAAEKAEAASLLALDDETAIALYKDWVFRTAIWWAARRGQTYPSNKFILEKLARAGLAKPLLDRVAEATGARSLCDAEAFRGECEDIVSQLQGPRAAAASFTVALSEPLRRFSLLGAVWVASRRNVYVVREDLVEIALSFPLEAGTAHSPREFSQSARAFWGELHRHGLATLRGPSGVSWTRDPGGTLAFTPFAITWSGIAGEETASTAALRCVPLPVETVVAIGLDLIRCGMFFANKKEDAIGAIRAGRWRQAEDAFGGMVLLLCQAALLSAGGYPAPSEPWIMEAMERHPVLRRMAALGRRARAKPVRDARSAKAAFAALARVFDCLPRAILGDLIFSMETSRAGHKMLEKIMAWGQVGEALGVDLPIFRNEWPELFDVARGRTDLLRNKYLDAEKLRVETDRLEDWARADDVMQEIDSQLSAGR